MPFDKQKVNRQLAVKSNTNSSSKKATPTLAVKKQYQLLLIHGIWHRKVDNSQHAAIEQITSTYIVREQTEYLIQTSRADDFIYNNKRADKPNRGYNSGYIEMEWTMVCNL